METIPPVTKVNVHVHTESFECAYCAKPFARNQHVHKIISPFSHDSLGYWTVCTDCKNDINYHLEGDGELAGPGGKRRTVNLSEKRVRELLGL